MTARILLIAPHNSYRTGAYLEAARTLGIEVVLASEGEHSLVNDRFAGVRIRLADEHALEHLLAVHRQRCIQGVVATDDASVPLTSRVAGALGLSHNSPESARRSRRKDRARACLAAAGLPVPDHRLLDLREPLASQVTGFPFPAVIKPLAMSGSRGIIRVEDGAALLHAAERVHRILMDESSADPDEAHGALLEAFVPGPEIALEGLLREGRLEVLAIFDKPDPMDGPFFEETYYITPSRHPPALLTRARERVQQACLAYGLREGPVHAELRLWRGDAWIMEVASRTIGGYCGRLLRFGTGHSLESLVISHAIGRPLPRGAMDGAAGVLMIPTPEAGVLRRVEGVLEAGRIAGIEEVMISVREGYELVPLPEGSRYLGFVFARGERPEEVESALRAAHARLRVVVAPVWKLDGART